MLELTCLAHLGRWPSQPVASKTLGLIEELHTLSYPKTERAVRTALNVSLFVCVAAYHRYVSQLTTGDVRGERVDESTHRLPRRSSRRRCRRQ